MTETQTIRPVGFTTEHVECDRCGREELRGTVVMANEDGEVIAHWGTTCASRVIGRKVTRADALATEARRRTQVLAELRAAHRTTDQATRDMHVAEARRIGIVRADEVAFIAKLVD